VDRHHAGDVGTGAQELQGGGAAEAVAEQDQPATGELGHPLRGVGRGSDASHPAVAVGGHRADQRADLIG